MTQRRQQGGPERRVEVEIGGRRYRLRGEDEALLRRLARKVDSTIKELSGGAANDDPRIPVLAALNIAGEQEERERDHAALLEEVRARAARARERLSRVTGPSEPSS